MRLERVEDTDAPDTESLLAVVKDGACGDTARALLTISAITRFSYRLPRRGSRDACSSVWISVQIASKTLDLHKFYSVK